MQKKNFLLILASATILLIAIILFQLQTSGLWMSVADRPTDRLEKQSESSEIEAIEKDLNTTDLSDIDRELNLIDQELNSF